MTETAGEDGFATIQSLIWPEQGICTEPELYARMEGPCGLAQGPDGARLELAPGAIVGFDTWFNLFNIGKWRRHCAPGALRLWLEGAGELAVTVTLEGEDSSAERVLSRVITLNPGQGEALDLSHVAGMEFQAAVLFLEVTALGRGALHRADWQTDAPRRRTPELMLSVTTFRREAEVARTVARFEEYMQKSPVRDHIRMTVVDNGQSLDLPDSPHVTVIGNENLGGSGGFARGMLAARDTGASHCLFMDDDAATHMESIERTWCFLAWAVDPSTTVAGAMIHASWRWSIWENGARFHGRCIPQHLGTDLRDPEEMLDMEFASTPPAPGDFYGGWWFFAFPLDHAQHMPFPFFVRGDDVSFSLANDFEIVTLNGVASFQESFTDKESPQTWYLDLRSHMAHHLSLPGREIGARGLLKTATWFFLRNLPRMHYDTLAAIRLAMEDVMRGPGFFEAHADMAERRGDLKALTTDETWAPAPPPHALPPVRSEAPPVWYRMAMKLTLNGLLVPFFRRTGRHITLEARNRGRLGWIWGASRITFLSADRQRCYTVTHSKRRAWEETVAFVRTALALRRAYPQLLEEWRGSYDRLTGETWWRDRLKMEKAN